MRLKALYFYRCSVIYSNKYGAYLTNYNVDKRLERMETTP